MKMLMRGKDININMKKIMRLKKNKQKFNNEILRVACLLIPRAG